MRGVSNPFLALPTNRAAKPGVHRSGYGPDHRQRRGRLPLGHVPRRDGKAPLPAPARIHGTGLPAAPDPRPARSQPRLLRPADDHGPARGPRKARPETRLPPRRAPPVLRPPLRRRADLLHRQGPCQQRHQPRLVPPHGTDPDSAVHRRPVHHPQRPHPVRLRRPPGPERPASRRRAPAENPPPAPQNTHQPRRRAIGNHPVTAPGVTQSRSSPPQAHSNDPSITSRRANRDPRTSAQADQTHPSPATGQAKTVRPKREHKARSNVKTSGWAQLVSNQ